MTQPVLTRRTLLGFALSAPFLSAITPSLAQDNSPMQLRFTFHDQSFTATLADNASARELADMLPLDLTISDFGGNEKIAYLPRKLTQLTRGPFPNPAPGDLCYYVPWGNLALFHGAYDSTSDLVRLGRLDGDVTPLLVRGEFPLRLERL